MEEDDNKNKLDRVNTLTQELANDVEIQSHYTIEGDILALNKEWKNVVPMLQQRRDRLNRPTPCCMCLFRKWFKKNNYY